jgi:competence protein ComGC
MAAVQFVLEFAATLTTAIFAGASLYITLVEHPARMECGTAIAAAEFRPSYRRATIMQASLAGCAFLTAVSAWWLTSRAIWFLGGILIGAVVPFTLIVILPTNKKLLDPAIDKTSDTTRRLLTTWGRLHAVRTGLSLLALIVFLAATAFAAQDRALEDKEALLRQDLFTLRDVIQQYTLDKQREPQSLDDLKESGYIRKIPLDPMTGKPNWKLDMDDAIYGAGQWDPGIWDVHSSSSLVSSDGSLYSSWS